MKRTKKTMKVVLICVAAVVTLAVVHYVVIPVAEGIIISGVLNFPISEERMEKILNKDYDLLVTVTNYFVNSDYESITILSDTPKGEMSIKGDKVKIEDTEVVQAINNLQSRGYDVIAKDGDIVSFQRWSIMNNDRGIAYSVDGGAPTSQALQFLTKVEPMTVPNWYYYEQNFNEWRLENP